MKKIISVTVFSFSVAFSPFAFSEESELQDLRIVEKVKQKKYLNGAEEGELQIQAQLHKPQRKISPVVERPEEDQPADRD